MGIKTKIILMILVVIVASVTLPIFPILLPFYIGLSLSIVKYKN